MLTLPDSSFQKVLVNYNSRRIEKAFEHMNNNYDREVNPGDIARLTNMTKVSFSRFIKK